MKRIWKFPIPLTSKQYVHMPVGSKLLTVQIQNMTITIWALCDPEFKICSRRIIIHGTGTPVAEPDLPYIGTVQFEETVWHIFDGGETK